MSFTSFWYRYYSGFIRNLTHANNGIESSEKHLPYGVSQGSVPGPLLYSLHTSPLDDIARKKSIPFHLYTDDRQSYVRFIYSIQLSESSIQRKEGSNIVLRV